VGAAADLSPLEPDLVAGCRTAASLDATFTFASSGTLARQIENGAPFDVFLAANQRFIQQLVRSGYLVPDSVEMYATGKLGLWSKGGAVRSLQDLLSPAVRHVAIPNPAHAPYGEAARQALVSQKVWPKLESRIVLGENVRQAFQYAETGNADACLTAWTLVFQRGGIPIPEEWHSPILQSGGVVASSGDQAAARRFMSFLMSSAGAAILQKYGLTPVSRTSRK
jgi:molybdate transport system substrate-binding protein